MTTRPEKLNSLVHSELAQLINREIEFDEPIFITITRVQTSKDLRHARVYFSTIPDNKKEFALTKLINNASRIRGLLFKRLSIKFPLNLRFIIDETEEKAQELESYINEVIEQENMKTRKHESN